MDQPLFYNKSIINPDTNLPYDRNKPPFKDMKGIHYKKCNLYSIYSLTNFNFDEYKKDPEIQNNSMFFLNSRQLNQKFSTDTRLINLPDSVWRQLIAW